MIRTSVKCTVQISTHNTALRNLTLEIQGISLKRLRILILFRKMQYFFYVWRSGYLNIPLSALKEALHSRSMKHIPTEILIQMLEFVLRNNYFEISNKMFRYISGMAIDTKISPLYECIYKDKIE